VGDPVDMTADYDREQTPTAPPGSCFRRCGVSAVTIVAPAPGSRYEAERLPTCIDGGKWAWCGVGRYLRLGAFELYLGPDRRESPRIPFDLDRRRPTIPPRQDDT